MPFNIDTIKRCTRAFPALHRAIAFSWQFFIAHLVPDKLYLQIVYKNKKKRPLNLVNPTLFNEKLQWLKLYHRDPLMTVCADKYEVREYVKEKVGDSILNELYGVYESARDISLEALPDAFVLKTNHGSGRTHIIRDKSKADWKSILTDLDESLASNYFYWRREWVYKNIKPRIICEKLLLEDNQAPLDYKFHCFNSRPWFVQVDYGRFTNHTRNFFDTKWSLLPVEITYDRKTDFDYTASPKNLDLMLNLSHLLSGPFPFARVDFYEVEGKVIFGEITFYPESGFNAFNSDTFNEEWGRLLDLPK